MTKKLEMLTVAETAQRAGVSEFAVRGWIRNGTLKHVKAGRKILINWQAVIRFLGGDTDEAV